MLRGIFDSLVHENHICERNQEYATGQPTRQDGHGVRIPGRKYITVGGSSRVWVFEAVVVKLRLFSVLVVAGSIN